MTDDFSHTNATWAELAPKGELAEDWKPDPCTLPTPTSSTDDDSSSEDEMSEYKYTTHDPEAPGCDPQDLDPPGGDYELVSTDVSQRGWLIATWRRVEAVNQRVWRVEKGNGSGKPGVGLDGGDDKVTHCKAETSDGSTCRNPAGENGYCHLHGEGE